MPREPGFLSRILYRSYYREGKGEDLALPTDGKKLFFFLLLTYPWKLILLNLLSVLLCIPIVTIPATFAALSRVTCKLAMQGYCDVFGEYFGEWKRNLVRYLPFFLLTAAPAAMSVHLVWRCFGVAASIGTYLLVAVSALVFIFVFLLWSYAFPLFAYVDLSVAQNVRNALFFVFNQRRSNLLLILLPLGITLLLALFLPYSAALYALCHLSIASLLGACIIKPALCAHVIQKPDAEAPERDAECAENHHDHPYGG